MDNCMKSEGRNARFCPAALLFSMHALHVLFQLFYRAGSYQYAGYAFLFQYPYQSFFGQSFAL